MFLIIIIILIIPFIYRCLSGHSRTPYNIKQGNKNNTYKHQLHIIPLKAILNKYV